MRLWCYHCDEAVDAEEETVRELMDRDVPNSVWQHSIYKCPYCGRELTDEPNECIRCGVETPPDERMCDCCHGEMFGIITTLQDNGKYTKSQVYEQLDTFLEIGN